ncbi:MAG: YihY/virulence factor BrkB family protein [Bacteroidota bacterium]|nr:YihY/virulence factor BrkB family protein [Bacteroidota bacterium]
MKRKFSYKDLWPMLKQTFNEWNEDDPFRHSAIIAYYAIFSLPALMIIIITVAGMFVGEDAVQGQLSSQIEEMIGPEAASGIETMIANSSQKDNSVLATIIGIGTLLFGATAVFYQLQKSLNILWGVEVKEGQGIKKLLVDRATSLGVILVIGFLLLISLTLTTFLSALSEWITSVLPDFMIYFFFIINFIVSFGIVTVLFAMIYKILPDVEIGWKSVWIGATITALLFEIGRFALGIYFGNSDPASAFGAAGSVILILLWVSYSCLILFFGAQFTKVYAQWYGHGIRPSSHATKRADMIIERERRKAEIFDKRRQPKANSEEEKSR